MHVAVTGTSGRIGSQLVASLRRRGHTVTRLVRRPPAAPDEARWHPAGMDPQVLEGVDGVVHLAGEPIESHRWNDEQKRRIHDSRAEGTRVMAQAVAAADDRPGVLVVASGINYYGDRGDEVLTEESAAGSDFMARVCRDWEAAADPARDAGVRTVHLRTGMVLDRETGALAKMLPLARLGLLGRLGSGRQYWSWIAAPDVMAAYHHALVTDGLSGPVNATSPNPVTQAEFARSLADVLGRPMLPVPAPRFGPKLVFGEMGDTLVFTSARVLPERLMAMGYEFAYPNLGQALQQAVKQA